MGITTQFSNCGTEQIVVSYKFKGVVFSTSFAVLRYGRFSANFRAEKAKEYVDKHVNSGMSKSVLKMRLRTFNRLREKLHF